MATAGQEHSSCRCTVLGDTPSRNLIVCLDGTCQRPSTRNTNILELCSQLVKSDNQLIFYNTGIGVSPDIPGHHGPLHQASDGIDVLIGRHVEKGIMLAYAWLCKRYKDGDKIFLFGFSRGAYQVRALAGMIERVGLLPPDVDHLIGFAFEAYSKSDDAGSHQLQAAEAFKGEFSRSVRVHFVGVWDTVSSVGVRRRKVLPLVTSCDHICYFRQALALDERRVRFLPECVYGGRTDLANNDHVKEVWFPGSHSDVGGGNRLNPKLQLGEIPLLWMQAEASLKGLQLKPSVVMWKIEGLDKPITPPLNIWWWLLEILPFQRLCYNNTSRTTSRPHMGGPRQILRGQKVHVSALFKSGYKPGARFHHEFETWPAALLWNDPRMHDRLQQLSSTWEMDIFDSCSVQSLLAALQVRRTNVDALDRLAFMASFDSGRSVIAGAENAKQTLASLLEDGNNSVRVSAAVAYCEVGWKWPLQSEPDENPREAEHIIQDVNTLLESKDPRRACMSLPSLCKNTYLRGRLLSESNLRRLLRLIATDRTGICFNENEDEGDASSSIAFHSAQALTSLLESDENLCIQVTEIGGVSDLIPMLYSHHNTVLVSVIQTLTGLARCGEARKIMCAAAIVPTLMNLARRFDDFITPAAIDLLCLLLDEASMQTVNGTLPLFIEITRKASDAVKQTGVKALVEFAKHTDDQKLIKGGCVGKLAKQAQSLRADHQDGAIRSLVELNAQVPTIVRDALAEVNTIETLISRLRDKSHCLTATSALVSLMAIDHVADTVINSGAPVYIHNMFKRRWFDGHDGEDGVGILRRVLSIDALRAALLKIGTVDSLLAMIQERDSNVVYAGVQYLREVIRHDDSKRAASIKEMIPPVLNALGHQRPPLQRSAVAVLHVLFDEENLYPFIFDGLLSMLESREAGPLYGAATALRVLCFDEKVRNELVTDTNNNFWKLSHDYYNRLEVRSDKKGPSFREVYQSVGSLITTVQEGVIHHHISDSQWLESAPYELQKEHNPVAYCTEALETFIHSPFSLFKSLCQRATGQRK